jgi:hypothetical protein
VTVHWSEDQGHRWRPSREGLTGGQRQAGNLARMRPSGKGLKHEARKAGEMTPGLGQDEGVGSPGVLRPNDTRRAEWAPSVRSELSKGQIWRRLVPLASAASARIGAAGAIGFSAPPCQPVHTTANRKKWKHGAGDRTDKNGCCNDWRADLVHGLPQEQ